MRNKVVIWMMMAVALTALPAKAQTYGNPYKPTPQNGMQLRTTPSASFQSTSAMTGSGSTYSANPTLNTDGTAAYGAPQGGPRKAKQDEPGFDIGGIVVPPIVIPSEDDKTTPVGDAVLPLLLMTAIYAVFFLRKKQHSSIL